MSLTMKFCFIWMLCLTQCFQTGLPVSHQMEHDIDRALFRTSYMYMRTTNDLLIEYIVLLIEWKMFVSENAR